MKPAALPISLPISHVCASLSPSRRCWWSLPILRSREQRCDWNSMHDWQQENEYWAWYIPALRGEINLYMLLHCPLLHCPVSYRFIPWYQILLIPDRNLVTHCTLTMSRLCLVLAVVLAVLPLAASYCNLKTYHVCTPPSCPSHFCLLIICP